MNISKSSVPVKYRDLVLNIIETAKKNDITVYLSKHKSVKYLSSIKTSGYLTDEKPYKLAVACGKPFDEWFPVLLHESCHVDQMIDNCKAHVDYINIDVDIDEWLDGNINLSGKKLDTIIYKIVMMERDCEMRTIKKAKKWKIPFNKDEYIKKANSYLYFYLHLRKKRSWYKTGKEPYTIKEVWNLAPNHFRGNYKKIPKKLNEAFDKYLL